MHISWIFYCHYYVYNQQRHNYTSQQYQNTAWLKNMDSILYVYISWTIHGMWMIYIIFERESPNFQISPLERSSSAKPCSSSVSLKQNGYNATQDFCVYQRRTWDEFKRVLSVAHASQPVVRAENLEYRNQLSGVCWGTVDSSIESIFLNHSVYIPSCFDISMSSSGSCAVHLYPAALHKFFTFKLLKLQFHKIIKILFNRSLMIK